MIRFMMISLSGRVSVCQGRVFLCVFVMIGRSMGINLVISGGIIVFVFFIVKEISRKQFVQLMLLSRMLQIQSCSGRFVGWKCWLSMSKMQVMLNMLQCVVVRLKVEKGMIVCGVMKVRFQSVQVVRFVRMLRYMMVLDDGKWCVCWIDRGFIGWFVGYCYFVCVVLRKFLLCFFIVWGVLCRQGWLLESGVGQFYDVKGEMCGLCCFL